MEKDTRELGSPWRHALGEPRVGCPDKAAVMCVAVEWTYGELDRTCDRLAAGFALASGREIAWRSFQAIHMRRGNAIRSANCERSWISKAKRDERDPVRPRASCCQQAHRSETA
jgi:hypothetical protein